MTNRVHELKHSNDQDDNAILASRDQAAGLSAGSDPPENIKVARSVETPPKVSDPPFFLDKARPLDPGSFPNSPRNGNSLIPPTIPNVRHLLASHGIIPGYDIIRKKMSIAIPGYSGTLDNVDNVALSCIISLASLNGMPTGLIPGFVDVLADRNQINPVASWITSKPWDGVDRLPSIYATLVQREDFPATLKITLMYRWLISAVAAALLPSGFRGRGVLTLQGPQSIGKTAWVSALVPDLLLREGTVKLDHHLDAGNKDSLVTAISHWIVEVGELDSSFKKDVARLKGFLTGDRDKVRRPYARADSEYPRRTVFCATVNDHDFLVDATGNSRWWTIPVTEIDFAHGIDMQQLFAQLAVDFYAGEHWWLTPGEEKSLEASNKDHRTVSAIRERMLETVDLDRANAPNLQAMTPTELLRGMDIKNPTNAQAKECAAILRELFGDSKRIQGQNKWRVPLKSDTKYSHVFKQDEDGKY
jgi:predicted P-loop ATPase